MSTIISKVREKHGDEIAATVEAMIRDEWEQEFVPILDSLRDTLNEVSSGFQPSDMLQAQTLRSSYEKINAHLKDRKKLMISYRSRPSAIMVDPEMFEDAIERVEASLALLERKAIGGTPRTRNDLQSAWDALNVPEE